MTFVLTATKVLNILSKTLKDAVSGFFEFYSLREGGGLLKTVVKKDAKEELTAKVRSILVDTRQENVQRMEGL